ncbi:MAG: undecaprenyl diphosphate synthase family protein [Desulfurococcales archaeon]|nr:undecaprenyl diphosphate synthase family protein [Desulfurococcales archaeon]
MALPNHVGLIPDGNRRWAKRNGVDLYSAYLRGLDVLMDAVDYLSDRGVGYITVFAMSLDNCRRRSRLEIEILKKISRIAFERVLNHNKVKSGKARIVVLGKPQLVGDEIKDEAFRIMMETRWHAPYTVTILYCYSGEYEVEVAEKGYTPSSILIHPRLDLVIRTGGYPRLSGFLPLRADYAELYSTDTLWPDLTRKEIDEALKWYSMLPKNYGR